MYTLYYQRNSLNAKKSITKRTIMDFLANAVKIGNLGDRFSRCFQNVHFVYFFACCVSVLCQLMPDNTQVYFIDM
jgi:hypothetical protein